MDEKASKLVGYFSLARPIPGQQKVNGSAVKDEAIADMGGVKSSLYAAREIQGFDYDEFFRAFARQYAGQTSEKNELYGSRTGSSVRPQRDASCRTASDPPG